MLEALIRDSVRVLQAPDYTEEQREAALRTVYGVDTQLIHDGTYFVAELDGAIVGCGGWSRRKTLFGGDHWTGREADLSIPRGKRRGFGRSSFARGGSGAASGAR